MNIQKLVIGMAFVGLGLLFFFNNKNIAAGASRIYQKFYSEQNLKPMFRIFGVVLVSAGLVLIFINLTGF